MKSKIGSDQLLTSLKYLIEKSRRNIAQNVNAELTMLYWNIGKTINEDILKNERAEYGKQIVVSLSRQLVAEYGTSFSEKNLRRMKQFAEIFVGEQIVATLSRQLSWSHLKELIPIDSSLKREFYTQICILENWSVRTFRERIQSMLYERTAISKRPECTIRNELELLRTEQKIGPDLVFRDPYFLDFLGLSDKYSENDIETSIIIELQRFITELGSDFAFMARQKRLTIDTRDYYIDLLFYHRRLRCLVVVDRRVVLDSNKIKMTVRFILIKIENQNDAARVLFTTLLRLTATQLAPAISYFYADVYAR